MTAAISDRKGGELLEREGELAALAGALDAARSSNGRLLVVSGEPGIGKSSLLAAMTVMANRREAAVLRARGAELERDTPWGVALQLFERRMAALTEPGRAQVLRGAARLALPLLEAKPDGDQKSLVHGLYWLGANLAEMRPLVVLVDDAQWADRSTLTWLNYMAQRVEDLPLTIVVAYRTREPGADEALLGALAATPGVHRLSPAPLSADAVADVVRARHPAAEAEFCEACAEATGGNPFLLREVLATVAERGLEPTANEADAVAELAPQAVMRAVLDRIERLGDDAAAVAAATAVLGSDAPLRHIAALTGLNMAATAEAADALGWAGVLDEAEPLNFTHPLVRSAVYLDVPPARRARLHGFAARLLAEEGAGSDRVAPHLVKTRGAGSARTVDVLTEAGSRALANGEPEVAAMFLARALDEPPSPDRRTDVLVALAQAETAAGNVAAAEHYAAALEQIEDRTQRAEIAMALARVLSAHGQSAEAAEVLDRALREVRRTRRGGVTPLKAGDIDPLALALQATWVAISRTDVTMRPQAAERTRLVVAAGEHEPSHEERMMLAQVASEQVFAGDPRDEPLRLARLAYGDGRLLELETSDGSAWVVALSAIGWADELDEYERGFVAGLEDARRRGSVLAFATCSYGLNFSRYYTGRLAAAEADARQAIDAERYGWREYLVACRAQLAWTLIERGQLEQAEAAVAALDSDPTWRTHPAYAFVVAARGRIARARGDHEAALALMLEAGQRIEAAQIPNPAVLPWASQAALAARTLDPERAHELAAQAVERAERFGAPRSLGMALRAQALVDHSGGDRVEPLRAALACFDSSNALLERTRVLADLGAALRAAGSPRDAREPLREALDQAHRMGASALEQRTHGELVAAGARPRRPAQSGIEALTPSERRVAAMAAAGLTNREIAEALFVTVKAVQWHLGHAYRKLGVGGRDELPAELATEHT